MAIPAAGLRFLAELEKNNERDWFQPRKEQYDELVRGPMIELVTDINKALGKIAPDYVTDPPKAIYRIYRDTRFSNNKTPYKTHIGALLWHRRLGKDGGAALYFHVSPQELLIAGGVYHPMPDVLLALRQHIAAHHERLREILRRKAVREYFKGLEGDQLSRPPKGWCADHPAIDYLKHKDLLLEVSLPPAAATKSDALDAIVKRFRAMAPFVEFLNEPLLKKAAKPRDPLLVD
jgi:uncharacterized protein (TIGR02453 family)